MQVVYNVTKLYKIESEYNEDLTGYIQNDVSIIYTGKLDNGDYFITIKGLDYIIFK